MANTRIFYTLLSKDKLASMSAVQHYLAYMIKVMELATRYEWKSILIYDNEVRKLQAIYDYPWSFESNHLHPVMLTPHNKVATNNSPAKPTSTPRSNFANFKADSTVICRNFNSQKGCTLHSCNFAHVCNRKVAGKATLTLTQTLSHRLPGNAAHLTT